MAFHKNIQWVEGDAITEAKMQRMVANDMWLYDHLIKMKVNPAIGNNVSEGLKIAAGHVKLNPRKAMTISKTVSFGSEYFSAKCRPIILATLNTTRQGNPDVFLTIEGLRTNLPDRRGFRVTVSREPEKKKKGFGRGMYVHWIAIGW